jgi:hypothetical protein
MMTRLFLYLLAMMTGFSAAEAARPVTAVPASFGAEIGRAYTAVTVKAVEQSQDRPSAGVPVSALPVAADYIAADFVGIFSTTPIHRHDVILG